MVSPAGPTYSLRIQAFSLLLATNDVSPGVPGGKELGETAVFAGLPHLLTSYLMII